jgi:hypothetical protein
VWLVRLNEALLRVVVLVGILSAGPHNANQMVSESCMHAGEWDLRHMTGDTLFLTYRTWPAGMVLAYFFLLRDVATQTFGIVCGRGMNQGFVRIVTGDAG